MKRSAAGIVVVVVLLASPLYFGTAAATDVSATLFASNFSWHFGLPTGGSNFSVDLGGGANLTLNLTVVNEDNASHTFTLPHFNIDTSIPPLSTAFVNFTVTAADIGLWQFHCTLHPNMIGYLGVLGRTPPTTPGIETLGILGGIAAAFALVAVWRRRH